MQVNPRCCRSQGLSGILDFASSLLSPSGSPGGSAGGGSGPISVSPAISTQISPSISPIFQQQFQPTNSAATAGTASAPAFGAPGMAPDGSMIPGAAPIPQLPAVPGAAPVQAGLFGGSKALPWLILGAGLLGFFLLTRKGK